MSAPVARVREIAAGLHVGEQRYDILCPACGGGASKDKSFAIKKGTLSAAYICHRASCGFRGYVNVVATTSAPAPPKKAMPYAGPLVEVPAYIRVRMQSRIEASDFDRQAILWAPHYGKGRLALPIKSREGSRIGYMLRAVYSGDKPKGVIRMSLTEYPVMSWHTYHGDTKLAPGTLVLVEDHLSAYKASYFCSSAALLGTNLDDEKALEIMKVRPRKVIVALDEDATAKAARLAGRLSPLVDEVRVLRLTSDLKDLPLATVGELLTLSH